MTENSTSQASHSEIGPLVVSFVARSNTGKTTLLQSLVPHLKAYGVKVGVLKHHSHPTPFDVPGKDTYRLFDSGADRVVGASPVQVATFKSVNAASTVEKLVAEEFGDLDVVLTEGYKLGPYPKFEVYRKERSEQLLCDERELLAIATDTPLRVDVPQFGLDDTEAMAALRTQRPRARYCRCLLHCRGSVCRAGGVAAPCRSRRVL